MIDRNSVPLLIIRDLGEVGVMAERRMPPREPGDRRDHLRLDLAGLEEVPQPLLDEDSVAGLDTIRIERRKSDCFHGDSSLTGGSPQFYFNFI
jgi:hypothetical protein